VALQYDRLHGFHLVNSDDEEPFEYPLPIVPFKSRLSADRTQFGWLREGVLFLSGIAQDWTGYSEIVCTYAPTPEAVTLAANMILPDNALDVAVLALGAEMGMRIPDQVQRKTIAAEAKEAEEDYLNLIEERNDVEIGIVRRVFS
jgi:hypothetical protein